MDWFINFDSGFVIQNCFISLEFGREIVSISKILVFEFVVFFVKVQGKKGSVGSIWSQLFNSSKDLFLGGVVLFLSNYSLLVLFSSFVECNGFQFLVD